VEIMLYSYKTELMDFQKTYPSVKNPGITFSFSEKESAESGQHQKDLLQKQTHPIL